MTKLEKLKSLGLIGCLNETEITSENYKEHIQEMFDDRERLSPEVQDFNNGWHRQDTKKHICIWSDEWIKNHNKNLKCDSPTPENK